MIVWRHLEDKETAIQSVPDVYSFWSWVAHDNMQAKNRLNRIGASIQPWFASLKIVNAAHVSCCKETVLSFHHRIAESTSQFSSGIDNMSRWSTEPACLWCQMCLPGQWRQSKDSRSFTLISKTQKYMRSVMHCYALSGMLPVFGWGKGLAI